jgi:hypothetical protein
MYARHKTSYATDNPGPGAYDPLLKSNTKN